jgi:hypothetical protein
VVDQHVCSPLAHQQTLCTPRHGAFSPTVVASKFSLNMRSQDAEETTRRKCESLGTIVNPRQVDTRDVCLGFGRPEGALATVGRLRVAHARRASAARQEGGARQLRELEPSTLAARSDDLCEHRRVACGVVFPEQIRLALMPQDRTCPAVSMCQRSRQPQKQRGTGDASPLRSTTYRP